jgi:hypothetical protein
VATLDEDLQIFGFEFLGPAADQHIRDVAGRHVRLQGRAADIQPSRSLGHRHEQRPILFMVAILRSGFGVHPSSVSQTGLDGVCLRLLNAGSALSLFAAPGG